jgi:hypothetical protein
MYVFIVMKLRWPPGASRADVPTDVEVVTQKFSEIYQAAIAVELWVKAELKQVESSHRHRSPASFPDIAKAIADRNMEKLIAAWNAQWLHGLADEWAWIAVR